MAQAANPREGLERDGAAVPGSSTYEHMEMMWERPGDAAFVLDAVSLHTPASLGGGYTERASFLRAFA